MEPTSMLPPNERCVRSKIQLFLRLWLARQKYERARPFHSAGGRAGRLGFHLAQLHRAWARVVEFQKIIGLESGHFLPREEFELICIASAFAAREVRDNPAAADACRCKWLAYEKLLGTLSHDLNPFEFSERCLHCQRAIEEMLTGEPDRDQPIPMPHPAALPLSI